MTKQEIEKAIENGESVWLVDEEENKIEELHFYKNNMYNFDKNDLFINKYWIYEFRKLFKTKAEAEHYLHHANITRTEILPFLTWEEFKEGVELSTTAKNGEKLKLYIGLIPDDSIYYMYMKLGNKQQNVGEATEDNFYKAYDECVRLFRDGD